MRVCKSAPKSERTLKQARIVGCGVCLYNLDQIVRGAKFRSLGPGARLNAHKGLSYAFCTRNLLDTFRHSRATFSYGRPNL